MEINEVMQTLNTVGATAVSEYTKWFFISSIAWLVGSGVAFRYWYKCKFELVDEELRPLLKGSLMLLAGIIFLTFVPDLFAPQAAAIHQLLGDIRG